MKKHLALLLVLALFGSLLMPAASAEELAADGWSYDSEANVLVLKNYTGPVRQDFTGNLTVVAEGENTLTGTLRCGNLALVILADAALTIRSEDGSCLDARDTLVMTGPNGSLTMESTAADAPAMQADKVYAAGPGSVSVSAEAVGIQAETVVLQQTGVVEVQGSKALEGQLVQPVSNSAFLEEGSDAPAQDYDNGSYLQVRQHVAADVTEDGIGVTAPNASAISEQAMMACYDAQGKLLAVVPGTRDGDHWSFDNPGVEGTWKAFFLNDAYVPRTEAIPVPMTATAQATELASEETVSLQSVGGDYELAIEVVQELGIMGSYEVAEDVFEFRPEGSITREEAAKIVAGLAHASGMVSESYADACTAVDVQKNRWSASYIGYCQQAGIVSHMMKNGIFDPVARVTELELAVMLMTVLGYDSRGMGYCDRNWVPKARQDAITEGLFDGIGDINNNPVTRGEAAQMIWNALNADTAIGIVVSLNDTAKKLPKNADAYLSIPGNFSPNLPDGCRVRLDRDCNLVIISDIPMMEKIYSLEVRKVYADEFSRPVDALLLYHTKNDTIVFSHTTYPQPLAIYTTDQSLNGALGTQAASGNYTASLFHNGLVQFEDQPLTTALLTEVRDYMGNGVTTELYLNEAEKTVVFVVIDLYIAQLASVEGNTCTLAMQDGTKIGTFRNFENWQEGDWVQFHISLAGIQPFAAAQPIRGTVTRAASTSTGATFTMDGEEYQYSRNYGQYTDRASEPVSTKELGTEMEILVDVFGYVHYVVRPKPQTAVYLPSSLVKEFVGTSASGNLYTYTAKQISFSDAPAAEAVTIDESLYNLLAGSDAEYALLTTTEAEPVSLVEAATGGTADVDKTKVTIDDALYYLNANTQILTRTYDSVVGRYEYHYYDGSSALDWTETSGCPCQYLADGKNLTYAFFDLANAKAPVERGTAMVLSYAYSSTFIVDGNMAGYSLYNGILNGEALYLAAEAQLEENGTVYTADWQFLGTSEDGMPIYLAVSECVQETPNVTVEGGMLNTDGIRVDDTGEMTCTVVTDKGGTYTCQVLSGSDVEMYLQMHGADGIGWLIDENSDGEPEQLYIYLQM